MRQQVEDFATALDAPFTAGDADAELRRLITVAHAFQVLPVRPRPDFRADLRARLVSAAEDSPATIAERVREALGSWRTRRTMMGVAACAAVLVLVASVAFGTTRAVPGDPLYAAKRAAESLQRNLANGDAARVDVHIDLARRRLRELQVLASRGVSDHSVGLLEDMDAQTLAAARNATTGEARDALRAFALRQYADLAALLPQLDAVSAARAVRSLQLLQTIITETADAGSGGAPGSPAGPGAGPGAPGSEGALRSPLVPRPPATSGGAIVPGRQSPLPTSESPNLPEGSVPGVAPAPLPTPPITGPAPSEGVPTVPGVPTSDAPTPSPVPSPSPLPTATGTPVPPVPTVTVPPLPTVTAPPLPTVSLPPLPTVSVPPLPSGSLPPLPSASLPPLPTVSLTPLPTASLPPLPTVSLPPLPSVPLPTLP